jgi:Tol biopolymer transport system component
MTPERWRQITALFHAAAARPAADHAAFLDEECVGDTDLRAEVAAMLAAHDGEAGTPEVPMVSISSEDLELEAGDQVGPYEVHALIGAGGMGRVYRARDSRLDREVAIKVLPSLYAADADRLRRFEQEARASGALTHPNLVTVYDVGLHEARPYLVTELLDGETLRDRLARGATPPARACDIAAALARGLAAAHAKGIVHRDLKPENVIITRDGRVKIVDFGVAKLRVPDARTGRAPDAQTVHTESGVIIGTPGYMAPEQIRGLEADGRADVFALGAILFELLTGRRAFDRPSRAATLEATLRDDPVSAAAAHECPPRLLRILQRCLEKDAEARFQSAADLAFALDPAAGPAVASDTVTVRSGARAALFAVGIAVVLLLAAGVVVLGPWFAREVTPAGDQLARFALPIGARVRFTGTPTISRDGTTIVYPANEGPVESQQLYVRRIDQLTTVVLPGTERGAGPFISPDGQSVAFWADGALKRTRLDGTASPTVICAVESFLGGAWTSDDTIVFASTNNGLQQVHADGGPPRPFTAIDPARSEIDHHAPAMLPGGRALLLSVHEGEGRFGIDVLTLATGARRRLIDGGFDARYVPTGHIVYATGTALFAVPFDAERLERSGPPIQLLDGVSTFQGEGRGAYALSDTGTMVFLPRVPSARRVVAWVDRAGASTPLPLEPREYWTPRLSPDASRFAVVVQDQEAAQIWIHHFANGTFSRLTSDGHNWSPVWSRDGSHLFYASDRDGQWQLVREALDGGAVPEVLVTSAHEELAPGSVSADGRSLVYTQRWPNGHAELRVLDLARRQSTTVAGLPDRVGMPVVSPDGRWLGFTAWTPVRPSVFVRPLTGAGTARQLVEAAGYTVWSRTGDAIYFRSRRGASAGAPDDGVFELPFDPIRGVATGPERQLFRAKFTDWMGVPGFDVSPDGRFLLVLSDGQESLPRDPVVVLNVDDDLRRRAPVAGR